MTKNRALIVCSESLMAIRLWFAEGGVRGIARGARKAFLHLAGYMALLAASFLLACFLGIIVGAYMRLLHDGSRLYFTMGRDWAEHAKQTSMVEEAKTVCDIVPFIDLNSLVRHWSDKQLSKTEVLSREYFNTQMLPHGTAYIPWLWEPTEPRGPVTVTNDHVDYIVIVLIERHGTGPRVGLIPLDEYEEFLQRTGRARKGDR